MLKKLATRLLAAVTGLTFMCAGWLLGLTDAGLALVSLGAVVVVCAATVGVDADIT